MMLGWTSEAFRIDLNPLLPGEKELCGRSKGCTGNTLVNYGTRGRHGFAYGVADYWTNNTTHGRRCSRR